MIKYGLQWPDGTLDLQVEMYMIQKGGKWTDKGATYGRGNSHHYEEMRRLLWPHLDAHRWHNLCRDEVLREGATVTVLMGPGSSGKTHEAAWIYLCEYFCFPNDTCVLVSSTDIRGLKLRVWGEITMLWEAATRQFDFLPGNLLDSKLAITTESLDDGDFEDRIVRDMRRGIIGIPTVQGGRVVGLQKWIGVKQKRVRLIADEACFPAGTMVDTPLGPKPIESIRPGDIVVNANRLSTVRSTIRKRATQLVQVKSSDGRTIICTPTHPFFTQKGWVCACELNRSHYMISAYEAMSLLWNPVSPHISANALRQVPTYAENLRTLPARVSSATTEGPESFLQPKVQAEMAGFRTPVQKDLRPVQQDVFGTPQTLKLRFLPNEDISVRRMRAAIHSKSPECQAAFLQSLLRGEMEHGSAGISSTLFHKGEGRENSYHKTPPVQKIPRSLRKDAKSDKRIHGSLHELTDAKSEAGAPRQNQSYHEVHWTQANRAWWKWHRTDSGGKGFAEVLSSCHQQLPGKNRQEEWERLPDILQGGRGIPRAEARRRGGREISSFNEQQSKGREEDGALEGAWVASVQVFEQADSGNPGSSASGIEVYNLEVAEHPSYSVNGFLVHNSMMGASFLSAFSNLNKNESFQAIVLGNPMDPLDPLGKAAEPRDGWTPEYLEPEKTKVWDTRFMNGRCVNLIGLDSPNMDFPQDQAARYKYLISRKKIEETLSFFQKDSVEYYSQCVGSMKIGTMARRVITREMCLKFGAMGDPIWAGGAPTTKLAALDAAYGGDRCALTIGEFGEDKEHRTILAVEPPIIVPISVKSPESPEDQIAAYCKSYCEKHGIAPENFFHDSTGRGSLGTALARAWSAMTNPVEFGGAPTERPVALDLFIYDPITKQRRLKTAKEHYFRFLDELWFAVRYLIEAGQFRGMTEAVMEEGCMREWIDFKTKKRMETKEEMKDRVGRSPDLFDSLAILVEGARRRGLQIQKLANSEVADASKAASALYKSATEFMKLQQKRQLQRV